MAELNSEGKYSDLQYTNFPAAVDSWDDVMDVSADTIAQANQYMKYCEAGNYAAAQSMLDSDSTGKLKRMQINALIINQCRHAIMAIERMWRDDIESYIVGQVFADNVTVSTYTHSYNYYTKVHNFVGKGANGKVKCTASFNSGDSIAINGTTVSAYCGQDTMDKAGSDLIISGHWISFTYSSSDRRVDFISSGAVSFTTLNSKLDSLYSRVENLVDGKISGSIGSISYMSPSVYDPRSKRKDVFAAAGNLYTTAVISPDNWSSSYDGSYTQTVYLSASDGGPTVYSNSICTSSPMCEPTGVKDTDETLQEALNIINAGTSTLGTNQVTIKVWEKPTCEIRVKYMIRPAS